MKMIHFRLKCSHDHEFEAWFPSSDSFDQQCKKGDVDCPVCGDVKISKALMTPSIAKGNKYKSTSAEVRAQEVAEQIIKAAKKIREVVEENFEYVGNDFANEARAIHYGETDQRDIYGETTEKEAEELDEEGIEFSRIPKFSRSPRRRN